MADWHDGALLMRGIRLPWRYDVRATAEGVVLRRGDRFELLRWSSFVGSVGKQGGEWHVVTRSVPVRGSDRQILVRRIGRRTNVSRWFSPVANEATAAVIAFVASTPVAQRSLSASTDVIGCHRTVRGGMPNPAIPAAPMLHSAGRHEAILAVLDEVWPRRFSGYPCDGEDRPSVGDVLETLAARSAMWVRSTPEDELRAEVERHLSIGAWPFHSLVGP